MRPFQMPDIPPPCFNLRSRREVNTVDQHNSRFHEYWQADTPSLEHSRVGEGVHQDMNPTPSRLYREDMRQSQPYVIPTQDKDELERLLKLNKEISNTLQTIDILQMNDPLSEELRTQKELYKTLIERKNQFDVNMLSRNPYFDKYDVQGDTPNIIRELRSVVTEDIIDRGLAESQKLLRRGMENRWVPANFAETQRLDSLNAYELMMPKINNQNKVYH